MTSNNKRFRQKSTGKKKTKKNESNRRKVKRLTEISLKRSRKNRNWNITNMMQKTYTWWVQR